MRKVTITIPNVVCIALKRFLEPKETYEECVIRILTQLATNPSLEGKDPNTIAVEYKELLQNVKDMNVDYRTLYNELEEYVNELRLIKTYIGKELNKGSDYE